MNVFVSFQQNGQPVVPIEYCSVGPSLKGTGLSGPKRGLELLSGEAPELGEFARIHSVFCMEKLESRLRKLVEYSSTGPHGAVFLAPLSSQPKSFFAPASDSA